VTEKITVVVADDHPLVLRGTCDTIAQLPDFEVVGRGADGDEALALVRALKPRILLVDIQMPKRDGIAVVKELAGQAGRPAMVVLTSAGGDALILRALQAGADGYLLKTATEEELQRALRLVAGGMPALFQPEVSRAVVSSYRTGPGGVDPLTEREVEIVRTLAHDLSNKEIAARLGISERTVQQHLSNVFSKLGVASRTGAVLKALHLGTISLEDTRT
jgi:DNA-binding NarL/FixJ family response regulator